MKRFRCFIKKMKWKSMGVKWDGHCWNAMITSNGDRGVYCIDCGKKNWFSSEEIEEEDIYWNRRKI